MNRTVFIGTVVPVLLSAATVSAGTLQLGAPTVEDHQVRVPISLQGDVGAGVSTLDFRFNYDASTFSPLAVTAGQAAVDAGKQVLWDVRVPGECVVVMMGMNQTPCQSGQLAHVVLRDVSGEARGTYQFAVTRPTFSSSEGKLIAAEGSTETLELRGDDAGQTSEDPEDMDGSEPPSGSSTNGDADGASEDGAEESGPASRVGQRVGAPEESEPVADGTQEPAGLAKPGASGQDPATEGGLDRGPLATADELRDGLPTPIGGTTAPEAEDGTPEAGESDGHAAVGEGTVEGGLRTAPADGSPIRIAKATVENDKAGVSRVAQTPASDGTETRSGPSGVWRYVVGATLIVLAGLLLARKRLLT